VCGQHGVVIPGPDAAALLHRLHIPTLQRVRHRLNRRALQRQQLTLQVFQRPVALLGAVKERRKFPVVGHYLVMQGRHLGGGQRAHGRLG
jgi:hypothetical protein